MSEALQIAEAGLAIIGPVGMGFPRPQRSYARVAYGNAEPDTPTATWLVVRPDGRVMVYAGKVEYGQGIRSGLAIEVAEELRTPLGTVEVMLGDTDLAPEFLRQICKQLGIDWRKVI